MKTACPYCGYRYTNIPGIAEGRATSCKQCGEGFIIHGGQNQPSPDKILREWQVNDVILNLYVVKQILGQGGFGKVYRLFHRDWNLDLAVKTPNRKAIEAAGGVDNFEREAETWVNLGLYPNIVSCYYVRRINGIPRVFSEYVAGGDLQHWINSRKLYKGGKKKALARMLDIAIQFAWGLHYAHEQKLIHQDVKPANLMLTEEGVAKVTDFGLARAKAMQSQGIAGHTMMVKGVGYTPEYASPEQVSGEQLTRRTDIWSWAVSVFQMFSGERSWRMGTVVGFHLEEFLKTGKIDPDIPKIPDRVSDLLAECLQEKPEERPHTMQLVGDRLVEGYKKVTGKKYFRSVPIASRDNADSLNNRALSLLDLGMHEEALQTWRRALSIQPYHPESTCNRGLAMWHTHACDDDDLVCDLQSSLQLSQPEWLVRYLLGQVHLERGDCASALDVLAPIKEEDCQDMDPKALIRRASAELEGSRRCLKSIHCKWVIDSIELDEKTDKALTAGHRKSLDIWGLDSSQQPDSLEGHQLPVASVFLSQDCNTAVSGGQDHEVRLWDLKEKRCIYTYKGHVGVVTCVYQTHNNEFVVSGSDDQSLRIWDNATRSYKKTLNGHRGTVTSAVMDADCRRVLSGSSDRTLKLWDVESGDCLRTYEGHEKGVIAAYFVQKESRAVSCSMDGAIKIWNIKTGVCEKTMSVNTGALTSAALSDDGRQLLTGSGNGTLKLWDLNQGYCTHSFISAHKGKVTAVSISGDGKRALSCGYDKVIRHWNLDKAYDFSAPITLSRIRTSEVLLSVQAEHAQKLAAATKALANLDPVVAARHIRQARALPGFSHDREAMAIWRMLYVQLAHKKLYGIWESIQLSGHSDVVRSICLNQGGEMALSGANDATVKLWSMKTGKCNKTFFGHTEPVTAVTMTSCNRYVVSASEDKTIKLWDIDQVSCLHTFKGHKLSINSLSISPDNRYFVSGSDDCTLRLWEIGTGRFLRSYKGHTKSVSSCLMTSDGRKILSTGEDRTIHVWDLATGKSVRVIGAFGGHAGTITSMSASYDGSYVLTASKDATLKLWDISNDYCIKTYRDHTQQVTSVSMSPDGCFALSASMDGQITFWELENGRCLQTLATDEEYATSVVLSADKGIALSIGGEKDIHSWVIDWDLKDTYTEAEWDKTLGQYLKIFLSQNIPDHVPFPNKKRLSDGEVTRGLTKRGRPGWTEQSLMQLHYLLGCAGYGWIKLGRLRSELYKLSQEMMLDETVNRDNTGTRTEITHHTQRKHKTVRESTADRMHSFGRRKLSDTGIIDSIKRFIARGLILVVALGGAYIIYISYLYSLEEVAISRAKDLVQQGSDINLAGDNGKTLLHAAVEQRQARLAEYLISNGAYLNARDSIGWTPLHRAVNTGDIKIVKLLVEHGALINVYAGMSEISPLWLADDKGYDDIRRYLLEARNKKSN